MPPPPLAIRGLRKSYGRLEVLRGLDLEIPPAALCGLVGLNGSGKTTTIECVLGLRRFEGGEVRVLGHDPARLHRTRGLVGAAFDTPCLHPALTVRQVLDQARYLAPERARQPAELEELLGIARYRSVRTGRLSLGNRKRAAIAQALLLRPTFVVLDEPFSGLDAAGVDELLDLIRRLHREDGTTFVLSSHQLPYLEKLCSHFGILAGGRITRWGELRGLLDGQPARVRILAQPLDRARKLLQEQQRSGEVNVDSTGRLIVESSGTDPAALNRALVEAGLDVCELVAERPTLEALFRAATEEPA